MIELIFVIVLLGVLTTVAIPRLSATRDDAVIATIKADITTATSTIPSWYQSQKEADIQNAMQIDTSRWIFDSGNCRATYTDDDSGTIVMALYDSASSLLTSCPDANVTSPVLQITYNSSSKGIVNTLVSELGMTDQNISLGGNKVKW